VGLRLRYGTAGGRVVTALATGEDGVVQPARSGSVERLDRALESAIRELLAARADAATICPSEAARLVDPRGWRELMEPTRRAADRLVDRGEVEVVQGGRVVDPGAARGPIRIRRAR
jgi:Protein of unknown function (DUF3253)